MGATTVRAVNNFVCEKVNKKWLETRSDRELEVRIVKAEVDEMQSFVAITIFGISFLRHSFPTPRLGMRRATAHPSRSFHLLQPSKALLSNLAGFCLLTIDNLLVRLMVLFF